MSCLEVLTPGLFTTVQDLGRPGFAHLGISASGAADSLALRLGNLLVGNPENCAALELTLHGGAFRFPEGATFALAGSDFEATLDGTAVPPWCTLTASAGSTLRLGSALSGARGYLCIRGGIRVPLFLGSSSTHFLSGLGGVAGRALQVGDLLRIGREPRNAARHGIRPSGVPRLAGKLLLRTTPGPDAHRFAENLFYRSEYAVTGQANRMGLRLEGPELRSQEPAAILSQGVSSGSVQVTNAGQPLILFVEQQTTGGYPLIASVISVDLPAVGQLRPGDKVRFQSVTIAEAVAQYKQQEQWIAAGDLFE